MDGDHQHREILAASLAASEQRRQSPLLFRMEKDGADHRDELDPGQVGPNHVERTIYRLLSLIVHIGYLNGQTFHLMPRTVPTAHAKRFAMHNRRRRRSITSRSWRRHPISAQADRSEAPVVHQTLKKVVLTWLKELAALAGSKWCDISLQTSASSAEQRRVHFIG
jgi:hypothetical protein